MENLETVVGLLFVITLLAVIADKVHMPFPILLVIVGILASLIPGLPIIELSPEVVFLVFLPPLLYGAAWGTSWHDFKKAKRSISLLAVGCVLFTTTAVAVAAHYLIPGFTWPLSFLLGAIISPPDAVAATSVISKLGISKRVVTILEGESLVNDASGLIAYKYAMAAVITGNFVLMDASIQFVWVSIGGVAVGLGVALFMMILHKRIKKNTVVNIVLTFLTPFIAYLISETFHLSGVLAVVACGLYLSYKSSEIFTHDTRMQAVAVWQTVIFILNALVFILIGLQMRKILEGINDYSFWVMLGYGFVISLVTMVGRLIWVFPGAYLPRILSKRIREKETRPDWRQVLLVGWTGMRGVVSLAAALALPLVVNENIAFPQRDTLLFLTFCVIFFTLIVQGLSLPALLDWIKIPKETDHILHEINIRQELAMAAIEHIEGNIDLAQIGDDALGQIKRKYELRINNLNSQTSSSLDRSANELFIQFTGVQKHLIEIERKLLVNMRKKGGYDDEILRRLEYELDLEDARLSLDLRSN